MDHANARRARGIGGRLPLTADTGQEAGARRALLGERRVASTPVVPDGGRRDEHAGRPGQNTERPAQQSRALDAAPADPLLDRRRPAECRDALSRQVNDRIHPLERPGIEPPPRRIPRDVRGTGSRRPAAQAVDAVPGRAQHRHERTADES